MDIAARVQASGQRVCVAERSLCVRWAATCCLPMQKVHCSLRVAVHELRTAGSKQTADSQGKSVAQIPQSNSAASQSCRLSRVSKVSKVS